MTQCSGSEALVVSAQRTAVVWSTSIVSRCVRGRMCTGAGADVEQFGGVGFFESSWAACVG